MQTRLKKGLIAMAAISLTFATLSYAETHKGVAVHSAMTKGHAGATQAHSLTGHPQIGYHQKGHHQKGHHHWKATLSTAQNEKMEAMHLAIKRDLAPLEAKLKLKKVELKNLVTEKSPDMAAIKGKIRGIGSLRTKVMIKRYAHIVEMRKVLTPAQRRSFDLEFLSGVEHWRGHEGH